MSILFNSSSNTIYRVPKKFRDKSFDTFEWGGKEKLQKKLEEFANRLIEERDPHLLMLGPPGRGKSHLGISFYKWLVYREDAAYCVYHNVPQFCDKYKNSFNDDSLDVWTEIENCQALILDDILARDFSSYEMENVIFRLINTAYSDEKAIIVTDNNNVEGLSKKLRKHELSRLLEGAMVLNFNSLPDYRLNS